MSLPAIDVENLSKSYRIRHELHRTDTSSIRDEVMRRLTSPFRRKGSDEASEEFWALQDVNFTAARGDVIGIIGRNGSGKSTLLKILSRIVEPTSGRAVLRGQVASLLEVGTGFHPELSGRENIYFNGSILGMSKRGIDAAFDSIVDFSGTEKFLDTPVKFYSSGMYVRLAFAVAAHLEPDILIVDEVLAVGDAEFQKKCLGRLSDVAHDGKTVLFVSHSPRAVAQLCTRGIYLEDGRVAFMGTTAETTARYLAAQDAGEVRAQWRNDARSFEHPCFTPVEIALLGADGNVIAGATQSDARVTVRIRGHISEVDPLLTVGYAIYGESGECLYWSYHTDAEPASWPTLTSGEVTLTSDVPANFFNDGEYRLELIASLHMKEWLLEPGVNAPAVKLVIDGGTRRSPYFQVKRPTALAPILSWDVPRGDR